MTIILHSASIDAPWFDEKMSYWISQLNIQEKQRYTSMKNKRKQKQMLLSRALLAQALTKFDCTLEGAYVIINYSTLVLVNTVQTFSISITHSGTMAAIALSPQSLKLGIDIEQIKARDFIALSKEICTKSELTLLHERNNIHHEFYQLWTAKESLAKASQCSLILLYQCDCSNVLTSDKGMVHWNGTNYHFNHINIQGYKGTIVANEAQEITYGMNHVNKEYP
jgi:phosphopantetheinyl transferase (holo-ACP synthase)